MSSASAGRASGRWLAPLLLGLGVAIGSLGVWYAVHARPTAGDYYEVFALDARTAVALRREVGSDRSFVELVELGRGVRWQALIPPYAGRPDAPGIAASQVAITVRVRRDGKDELWALSTEDADKLGQVELRSGDARAGARAPGVVTVADHVQSFELVGDATHATAVTAILLAEGRAQWRVDLGADGVANAWLDGRALWIRTAAGTVFGLARGDGARVDGAGAPPMPHLEPHQADGAEWRPDGDHLEVVDAKTHNVRGRIGE
jgi:hypothetical protein